MGLAFHPQTDVLYGIDNGIGVYPDGLYTVDITTGQSSLVGRPQLGNELGLAFVPEPSTILLLLTGALGLLVYRIRKR